MNLTKLFASKVPTLSLVQICGMKYFPPPPNYDHITIPERPRLQIMDKVPQIPNNLRPPRMQKKLRLMRGPEEVHNFLIHKQYGIMALGGGRLRSEHFEVLRNALWRNMDITRMFAIWRVDAPWQPITKKGQGHRMGGGKGSIDHYVTPIKTGRIILELAGKCEFKEVQRFLDAAAKKMPFQAMAVSQQLMDEMKAKEKWEEENNQNSYTIKYIMQNNMGGFQKWMSPFDYKFLGKHL